MTPQENRARAYCLNLNLDPDEIVGGYWVHGDSREWLSAPRWSWYQ